MFSNAKNVEINGKTVKSITLENGGILYKKEDEPYFLSVTSNKDVLSYYDNDSALLTARLTKNTMRIQGEEVRFYVVEDVPAGLSFTGIDFNVPSRSMGLSGSNIVIDWGDGSTTNYTDSYSLNHIYTSTGDYFITITGATGIEDFCFMNCYGLTSIVIPNSITNFGTGCFANCSTLTNAVIPDGVTSLGSSCFSGCSNLTNVVISDSVTNLGSSCFYGCSNLTSIVIPESITSLESECFRSCSNLNNIVIPDNVTSFGVSCFRDCSNLTSIIIPDSVTSLGIFCFDGCSNLTNLICNWTTNPPTFVSSWISEVHSSFKFSIPNGTTQAYIDKGYPSNKLVERSE